MLPWKTKREELNNTRRLVLPILKPIAIVIFKRSYMHVGSLAVNFGTRYTARGVI